MAWLLGIIGAILGGAAGATGAWAVGFVGGAAIGALTGAWISLRDRISTLESRLQRFEIQSAQQRQQAAQEQAQTSASAPQAAPAFDAQTGPNRAETAARTPTEAITTTTAPNHSAASVASAPDATMTAISPDAEPEMELVPTATINAAASRSSTRARFDVSDPVTEAVNEQHTRSDIPQWRTQSRATTASKPPSSDATSWTFWRWFGEGNWILKIGIGLLFLGVGALFKWAAENGFLTFPIEYRFIGVALAALAALGFGWRQRKKRPLFALNLQGGAIGILILTVFSAYRLYQLIPSSVTFALLLALVAGCAVLAILQNSLGLAVFGIIGGFAAPILASSGSGDHVALFSYYALLNLGIIAISWSRGWRVLNLLGFLFTFVIGTLWGVTRYRPEHFHTTEPFLILFFLMYLLIPLLPALRNPDPEARDRVDGSLVFGTPLIGFGLQAALLQDDRFGLAWSAIALAAVYAVLARVVWQSAGLARWRKAYAGLALVFATLAVPLALSAQWTSSVWAVEGALLVWLGLAQDERRLRWTGLALQLLGGGALLIAIGDYWPDHRAHAFSFGALLVSIAGLFSALQYERKGAAQNLPWTLAGWSFLWWYAAGLVEIHRHAPESREVDIALVFIAISGLIGALLRRALVFRPFGWPAHFGLLMALPFVMLMTLAHATPLADQGFVSWLVYLIASVLTLRLLDRDGSPGVTWTHSAWWLAIPVIAWLEINDWLAMQETLGQGWRVAAMSLPILIPLALLWKRVAIAGAPVRDGIVGLRALLLPVFAIAALMLSIVILGMPGSSAPLPWLPILNPLELTQIAALMMVMRCVSERSENHDGEGGLRTLMMAFGFIAISAATLRLTHHYGGESWDAGMMSRALPQSALSIVWTVLGIITMVIGARRARRTSWILGASILGLVLAKLLVIDMRFLGDLWGIISVLGVGVLFVAVGFFAPMPPREHSGEAA